MPRYYENVCSEAKNYAKEFYINEEKEKAFKDGVLWAVKKLERMVEGSVYDGMMDQSTKSYLSSLKVSSVISFCSEVKVWEKEKGPSDV